MIYIALIWNPYNGNSKHWIRQDFGEKPEKFFSRIKNHYINQGWSAKFYKAEEIYI